MLCSADQLRMFSLKDQDVRTRMEAEANRFAALLLMPPPILRQELRKIRSPSITDIVRLAGLFDVSKEAMARSYVEYSREAVAIIVVRNGRVLRSYRKDGNFPWIAVSAGRAVPEESIYHNRPCSQGVVSAIDHCEAQTWLGERDARNVNAMTEQLLVQRNGYALLLLHADMRDGDGFDGRNDSHWRDR